MSDFFSKEEDKEISKFNEASKKLERFNKEQDRINLCNINLQGFNLEFLEYNYIIKFNSLNSLFAEISAELTTKGEKNELKEGKTMRKKIKDYIKENPIHEEQEDQVTHQNIRKFNEKNWDELEELLFDYELMVKRFLKNHGISLPPSDDPALAAYR